jgi:predicted transposase/invertase (TIGR01784 family)
MDFFGISPIEIIVTNPYSINDYKEILADGKAVLREVIPDASYSMKMNDPAEGLTELQVRKYHFFEERSVYYTFDRFCKNYNISRELVMNKDGSPNRYSSLRAVYALNILGFNCFPDGDALRVLELYDPKRGIKLNKDLIKIAYFELRKDIKESMNYKYWQGFFLTGKVSPDAPEYLRHASEIVKKVNLSKEEQKVAMNIEKARADYDAGIADAYYDGKEEGVLIGEKRGEKRALSDVAVEMKKMGIDLNEISRITKIKISDIKKLHV